MYQCMVSRRENLIHIPQVTIVVAHVHADIQTTIIDHNAHLKKEYYCIIATICLVCAPNAAVK